MKIFPHKKLGQNFLRCSWVLKKIINEANLIPTDIILEIGPGEGVLTKELLKKAKVIAIEKDKRIICLLKEKFKKEIKNKKLILFEGDILNFDLSFLRKFKIIANIPYYLTGKLFRKIFESRNLPSLIVFLIQKEVAQRIVDFKKESILSLSIKAYGTPSIVCHVPSRCFYPQPKVDSSILKISNINRDFFEKNKIKENEFFEIIRKAFKNKRKKLDKKLNLSKEFLKEIGLEEKVRAENVPLEKWKKIYLKLKNF